MNDTYLPLGPASTGNADGLPSQRPADGHDDHPTDLPSLRDFFGTRFALCDQHLIELKDADDAGEIPWATARGYYVAWERAVLLADDAADVADLLAPLQSEMKSAEVTLAAFSTPKALADGQFAVDRADLAAQAEAYEEALATAAAAT